jgi:hypothetical protein
MSRLPEFCGHTDDHAEHEWTDRRERDFACPGWRNGEVMWGPAPMADSDTPAYRDAFETIALGVSGSVRTYEPTADTTGLTKVCIDTPPLTVTVEAPGVSVAEARVHALGIYREVWRDDMVAPRGAVGFAWERSPE